jgi:hypothetical protein
MQKFIFFHKLKNQRLFDANQINYCLVVDEIAGNLKLSGDGVEEILISKGSVRKGSIPPEPWRKHVLDNY